MINDLADYLSTKGLGSTTGTITIFSFYVPSTPDDCIVVIPTGGFQADGKLGYDDPTVQIYVRATNPATAQSKADSVYNVLQGLHASTLGDTYIVNCIGLQSAPVYIGRDADNRTEFSINFRLRTRNKTEHRI